MVAELGTADRLRRTAAVWLPPVANWRQGERHIGRIGTDLDHPLRHVGAGATVLSTALGQRTGTYPLPPAPGAQLWPPGGIHYPTPPTAERHCGASDPGAE